MNSIANERFWRHYNRLPAQIRRRAKLAYQRFTHDPYHNSLQFKCVNDNEQLYSVRIGKSYRALGFMDENHDIVWFWIGPHAEYDTLLSQF